MSKKVTFLCKASAVEGFGHITRCNAMIDQKPDNVDAELLLFPDGKLEIESKQKHSMFERILLWKKSIIVYDMNNLDGDVFDSVKADLKVSLSPFFEHNGDVDMVFNRTKYWNGTYTKNLIAGLDYAVIGNHVKKISDAQYKEAVKVEYVPIAISMGGDIWATVTNFGLLACKCGITPYEAAYAGMPTLVLVNEVNAFLNRELVRMGVSKELPNMEQMPIFFHHIRVDTLWQMRRRCEGLIDGKGASRVWDKILKGG